MAAYRASKAALAMVIRTLSIELARTNRDAMFIGLHPGTVDTGLSEPFQQGVPEGRLFTASDAVTHMLETVDTKNSTDSGKVFAYDGEEIIP
jgi:NAD(P)-dependent dehydrogenase (short-subunit alcohol dehydrogenase family)